MTDQKIITPNYEWFTYDVEVFAYDFIVVFKNKRTKEYAIFHNDNIGVRDFIIETSIYCGFNTDDYDKYVIKAICNGFSPEELKQVNDWLIHTDGQGWECPYLNGVFYRFNNVDIRKDMYIAHSLKDIEGHLYMSVEECDIPFDIDRPLTPEEIRKVIKYCIHDVDAADKITDVRFDYLRTKRNLAQRANIGEVEALASTNAKLTAKMLRAVKQERTDGRDYVYPPNLDRSVIPKSVLEFFETIHDMSIPDEVLFKTFHIIDIGGMPCKFAWGGVHGSLSAYYEKSTETRVIQNRDVSSLYPSLIEGYNYLSRNVPNPQLFYDIRKDRIHAKHMGDKQTATDLKLPLNTVSGAQENKYNDLYDPLPTRSLRISGQLFLTMLTIRLLNACKTIKLLNLNTDGLMYSVDKSELHIVDEISREWEKETKFELEVDSIDRVWIKDVNSLLFVDTNGKVKTVGSYLNYGISVKGAWSINNNMIIVKKALIEYFVNGTPVEDTINNCDNIFEFQLIAKAGRKYKEAYHMVDGEKQPIQKVNRVYATADERYGKLYKVKAENDATAKIEMLPEHCIIDNDNHLTIEAVDKTFYIEMARKRINDFLGIKPEKIKKKKGEKQMATTNTKTVNVYQKLLKARAAFLGANAKKSGKNMTLAFKYFELDDIVPIATKIFEEIGLISVVSFTADTAKLTIVNTDIGADGEETIEFTAPMIISEGNKAVTPVQALGATITYFRRYLYMIALDICEPDGIDGMGVTPTATVPTPTTTTPVASSPAPTTTIPVATKAEDKPLTSGNSNASETQIRQLKDLLIKLKDKDPSKEEMIAQIAVQTQGFTVISKADCEKLVIEIGKMLNTEGE